MKLALECSLGLGDIVVLTAAIRELKQQYGFDLLPIVAPGYNPLLRGSPHFRSDIHYHTRAEYPNRLDCAPMAAGFYTFYQHRKHFVQYALDWIGQQLGLSLATDKLRGEIWLTEAEKKQRPVAKPYWVLMAGGKRDATVKFYPHWQAVADGLGDVVQTGHRADWHPKLNGVPFIDCHSSRDFARLIYHSAGIVAPVTAAVHIAGAFGKPAVVLAGGYEPAGWIQYPGHIVLNRFTCGAQACFKKWAEPTGHGQPHQECTDRVPGPVLFPRCMNETEPEAIIAAVKSLA